MIELPLSWKMPSQFIRKSDIHDDDDDRGMRKPTRMRSRIHRSIMRLLALLIAATFIYVFLFSDGGDSSTTWLPATLSVSKKHLRDTLNNFALTEQQCQAKFPGLTKEIEEAASRGPFELVKKANVFPGLLQGKIKSGKVCSDALRFHSRP